MTLMSMLHSARFGHGRPDGSHLSRPNALARILHPMLRAHRIWQERQHLLTLDPSLLDDIGLNRAEAMAEAARPIWNVPQTWRL